MLDKAIALTLKSLGFEDVSGRSRVAGSDYDWQRWASHTSWEAIAHLRGKERKLAKAFLADRYGLNPITYLLGGGEPTIDSYEKAVAVGVAAPYRQSNSTGWLWRCVGHRQATWKPSPIIN